MRRGKGRADAELADDDDRIASGIIRDDHRAAPAAHELAPHAGAACVAERLVAEGQDVERTEAVEDASLLADREVERLVFERER